MTKSIGKPATWDSMEPLDTREDFQTARAEVRQSTLRPNDEINATTGYIYRREQCIGRRGYNRYLMRTLVARYVGDRIVNEELPSFRLHQIEP